MRLTLLRGDGVRLPMVVPVDARVLELRWAVQDAVTSYMNHLHSASNLPKDNCKEDSADCIPSSNIPSKSISWRNLWKTKCLALVNPHSLCSSEGLPSISARLDVLTNKLSYYQIRNGAVITFAPQLKRKWTLMCFYYFTKLYLSFPLLRSVIFDVFLCHRSYYFC